MKSVTVGVTGMDMFDGQDDLRVVPEVIPHFVLVKLVGLGQDTLRDVHVALFPLEDAGGLCRVLSHPFPVVVSPSAPLVVPIAYEAARGCHCAVIVNFVAGDGDLLQCWGDVSLLPSPVTKLDTWDAWQGICAKIPEQVIQLGRALTGSEVVDLLSARLRASFQPVSFKSKTRSPELAWRSLDPVIFARFAPPSTLTVQLAPGGFVGSPPSLQSLLGTNLPDYQDMVRNAFEAGRLAEQAAFLVGMHWKVEDFLDVLCTLKGLLLRLEVSPPFAPVEEMLRLRGKEYLSELSQDERDMITNAIRDMRWMVAGQVK